MAKRGRVALTPEQKLEKFLGEDTVREIEAMGVEELNKRIAQANAAIADTKSELEKNDAYVQVKRDKAYLESGFNEVKKRQNAIIKLALQARKDRGAA